jgi:amino acid adenylation domain-containing protein
MALLAAFGALLYRHTGQADLVVGTPIAGRNRREVEGLIGFFVNTLALRIDVSGNPTFRELLKRVRSTALGAYANQDLPFEKLVEELQPERDLSRTPVFQVMFNFLNLEDKRGATLDLPFQVSTIDEVQSSETLESKFDLTLYAAEGREGLRFTATYNQDLFDAARIEEMHAQFVQLLRQIVGSPDEKVNRFSLVTEFARRVLPDAGRHHESEWFGSVTDRLARLATSSPEGAAIRDPGGVWSYRDLNTRSNQVANELLERGIRQGDAVAIFGERGASLVAAVLGVMKAGGCFVILDAAYPASRLLQCLKLVSPRGWIQTVKDTDVPRELISLAGESGCRITLPGADAPNEAWRSQSENPPAIEIHPDDRAYIAFTSGTTGEPKAILGTHRPISHFLDWYSNTFRVDEKDRFSMLSGLSHDPVLRDMFAPLWVGATLCIPQPEVFQSGKLERWLREEEITVTHLTPGMVESFEALLSESAGSIAASRQSVLRYACFGGDRLTYRTVSKMRMFAPGVTCVNFYGATETPQAMGFFQVAPSDLSAIAIDAPTEDRAGVVPIGAGIRDVDLLVLNTEHRLAGIGEIGEIFVRTPYLTSGYLKDESLTASRFLLDPLNPSSGARAFRTGDLGRYRVDGVVEILGRMDRQVKVRGFRVEPAEIEQVLESHPDVRRRVVLLRPNPRGESVLAAYVEPASDRALSQQEVLRYVRERLPNYMVPQVVLSVPAIPLTPNGKIDVAALPTLEGVRPELEEEFVAPRTELEALVSGIWCEELGLEGVGVNDNFFDLGGHSLLAVRVHQRLREQGQTDVTLLDLFRFPTVSTLARHLGGKGVTKPDDTSMRQRVRKQSAALERTQCPPRNGA